MKNVIPLYITDHTGKKVSVIISLKDYEALMEELEELEDIKLYDDAKKSNEPSILMEDAYKMIEEKRKLD